MKSSVIEGYLKAKGLKPIISVRKISDNRNQVTVVLKGLVNEFLNDSKDNRETVLQDLLHTGFDDDTNVATAMTESDFKGFGDFVMKFLECIEDSDIEDERADLKTGDYTIVLTYPNLSWGEVESKFNSEE